MNSAILTEAPPADLRADYEALCQREEQLRQLIDGSADIIYEADARGFFTFVNRAAERLLGFPHDSFIGRHYTEVIRPDWRDITVDHYKHQRALANDTTQFEFPALTADGRTLWLSQNVQSVIQNGKLKGFRAIARDITQRRADDQRFQAFMENSPTIAFMKDDDGRIVYANALMNRLFAEPGATIVGLTDGDRLPADIEKVVTANDAAVIREGKPQQFIEAVPTSDGTLRHWLTWKFPVVAADGSTDLGCVAFDLTDRLQLERDLVAARDAALVSARGKSQFLANMSHEIRTPMNAIIGLLGVMLDTPLNEDQTELATTARTSAEALLSIINDILDYSKIEAGKLNFEVLEFDIRAACESVVDLLADSARQKSIEIGCVVDPDIPRLLRGDPGRLRQVLLNLLGNAIKFTPEGGVLIQVERGEDRDGQIALRFRVTDTGIGLSRDARKQLFRPFTQADGSTTRRFGGTGLGLAISRELVHMMQGEIGVESEPGCGATFWFTAAFQSSQSHVEVEEAPSQKVPRVLIVEDSTTTRQMMALQLSAWRVPNDTTDSATSALQMLRDAAKSENPYEVVISDLHMPHMDGMALARFVQSRPDLGSPRFVLVTSAAASFDAATLAQLGVTSSLRKPVRPQRLHDAVFGRGEDRALKLVAPPGRTAAVSSKRRVLVADDNVVNQKVTLRQLQKLGIAAEAVGNGIEALDAMERIAYDLVLMDCQMPEMDGYEATAELRRRETGTKRTPVIALTASASDGDRERCRAAGMDDFVSKPVRETDLAETLKRWLRP